MSALRDNPDVMMAVVAALVRRLGGTVTIDKSEIKPFTIMVSEVDGPSLHVAVMDYDHRIEEGTIQ